MMTCYHDAFFRENFSANKPFSFRYNGTDTAADFSELTEIETDSAPRRGYRLYGSTLSHSDGCLQARLQAKVYEAFNAVEWQLTLENVGTYDTYLVSDIHYCDIAIAPDVKPDGSHWEWPMICYARGSQARKDDFMMTQAQFYPDPGQIFAFHCASGRSSSEYMPYFNVRMSATAGVMLAIGWSGTWKASLRLRGGDPMRTVLAKVTFPDASFRLHPGEKVVLPSMLAMPWCFAETGEVSDVEAVLDRSHNLFRRFIYQYMLPKIDGKPIEGKICLRAWGGISEETQTRKINNIRTHHLPGEVYAIDAGWYGGKDWHVGAGDWEPVPELFPQGLKGLADMAAEAGLGFSAWLELERAGIEAKSIREHRDFYLGHTFRRGAYAPMQEYNMWYGMLLNLGYEPARRWIRDKVAGIIRESNMKIFRIDYNVEPADYWHYSDAADRKGITELQYINGLYQTFDELLAMFPDLIIDNCAGGGRRLDYAMGKRAIPMMCRSDYFTGKDYKPEGVQAHTYALSRWLPVHGDSAGSCTGQSPLSLDTYKFRSSIASGIGVPVPDWQMREEEAAWYRKMLEDAFRVRPFVCKDFYPLTGYTLSRKDWIAYRYHDYDTGNGVIMAFRREESAAERYVFSLQEGFDPADAECLYEIEDLDAGILQTVRGSQLTEEGISVEIPHKREARILLYRKKE